MAASVVSLVIGRLNDLLIQEAKFLHGVEDQVKDLQKELKRIQCFLEDADAVKDKDKRVRNWVAEVRELAYEAEDLLETYIFEVESRRRRGCFCGSVRRFASIFKEGVTLHKVGSEIESIKKKITDLSASRQTYGIRDLGRGDGSSSAYEKLQMLRRTYSHVVEEDFVDFHNDTSKLVKDLVDEEKHFRAISICGIGGLGKTTLAKQVYRHTTVRHHFNGFAWAFVSQQPKSDDILRGILDSLMPEKKGVAIVRYEELVKQVFEALQRKKCLVVLDDIWSEDLWNAIRPAFPTGGKGGSKILLTSRNKDVATYVDSSHVPYEPQPLNEEESWELFQKKIFARGDRTDTIGVETPIERIATSTDRPRSSQGEDMLNIFNISFLDEEDEVPPKPAPKKARTSKTRAGVSRAEALSAVPPAAPVPPPPSTQQGVIAPVAPPLPTPSAVGSSSGTGALPRASWLQSPDVAWQKLLALVNEVDMSPFRGMDSSAIARNTNNKLFKLFSCFVCVACIAAHSCFVSFGLTIFFVLALQTMAHCYAVFTRLGNTEKALQAEHEVLKKALTDVEAAKNVAAVAQAENKEILCVERKTNEDNKNLKTERARLFKELEASKDLSSTQEAKIQELTTKL